MTKQAKLTIDGQKRTPADPLIFGHFIEFMRDCIDGGMWAEVLKDRGFDRRKYIPEGVVDGNPNVAAGWERIGYKNSFEISLDPEKSLARDGFSQKIRCFNDYDGFVGIAQRGLYLEDGEYNGSVWVLAEGTSEIEILVGDEDGAVFFRKEFPAKDQWEKKEFSFSMKGKTRNGVLELRLLGEGTVWFDCASLMRGDADHGIWREVSDAIRALNPPVIRFPGGCFADCYHWMDGIGKRETRPLRHNRHWGGFEDNSFGTDEYMEFCRRVGCEPMICVNFGSGTPEEAADWVEYCNGSADTPMGRLRAENGHPEPYGVVYWDIGNETFGDWEIGHCSAAEYARKYLEFYEAMKAKDDSIVFMICGGDGDSRSQEWNRQISEIIGDRMDSVCLHMYAMKALDGEKRDNREIYYAVTGSVKKYEEVLKDSWNVIRQGNPKAKVAVTEYNLGTIIDSYREQTLEAAIFNAGMLNMFLRNAEKLSMCNISDLVNGWPGGCIVSRNGHAYGTATYYVMKLYSESRIREVEGGSLSCETYDHTKQIGNIEPIEGIPYVDAVSCRDAEGRRVVFAVNRYLDDEVELSLDGADKEAEVTELYSEKPSDMNREGAVTIVPKARREKLMDGRVRLKPHSVNRIVLG